MKITENELLRALEEADKATQAGGEPLVTTMELAEERGLRRSTVLRTLKALAQQGKLVIGKKRIKRIDGQEQWTTAYGLKR